MMNLAPRRSILEPLKQAALILTFALGAGGVHAQAVQGVTDTEIVLGTQQDLSGPAAAYGVPHRDGQVLALEEINAAGGIHGRKIRLVAENHGMDPKRAVLSMQKMISQDKIFALIDPLGSATTMALMPVALERNVPILFPAAGTESVYLPLSPLKFGLLTSSATQARAGVRFAVAAVDVLIFPRYSKVGALSLSPQRQAIRAPYQMILGKSYTPKRFRDSFIIPFYRLRETKYAAKYTDKKVDRRQHIRPNNRTGQHNNQEHKNNTVPLNRLHTPSGKVGS